MVSNLKLVLKYNILAPLESWLRRPMDTWKLLYKWTSDEKSMAAWHKQCDLKGPTITIIWANNSYVFGGYAHIPWASIGQRDSKESFIFSLADGKDRLPCQSFPYQNFHCCLYDASDKIGFGQEELAVFLDNITRSSSIFNGTTYPNSNGQYFLAGTHTSWNITEIETYLV